ncbi:MAG: Bax inhibitor-1/YccA family protein [Bacilli bacterium]|jgi:FtsH-binding integral membrane protein|nr:Bax inhibitor-1/YccA family protein [Bacilli bacterium]
MNEYNENTQVYPKMFTWLFIGLLITFASGYALTLNEQLMIQVLALGILPIAIIEIVIALVLGIRLAKMHPLTMKILYVIYSILTGVTFSVIFVAFEVSSLISIFIITAIIFALLAFYGYTTKRDLTKIGTIALIALLGIIIGGILNIFIFKSTMFDTVLTMLGVLIFIAYIAYDVNKVKQLMLAIGEEKAAVYGAFQLYLDFINLFIRLLELFGKRRD